MVPAGRPKQTWRELPLMSALGQKRTCCSSFANGIAGGVCSASLRSATRLAEAWKRRHQEVAQGPIQEQWSGWLEAAALSERRRT